MKTVLNNKSTEYATLVYPKWKRMGKVLEPGLINQHQPKLTTSYSKEDKQFTIHRLTCSDSDLFDVYYDKYEKEIKAFDSLNYGTDKKYVREGETLFNNGVLIRVSENSSVKQPIVLTYTIDSKGKSRVCKTLFHQNDIIECLVQKIAKIYQQKPFKRYCVLHVGDAPLADYVVEKLSRIIQMQPIFVDSVSSVIGVHAGKGAVAIAFDTGD